MIRSPLLLAVLGSSFALSGRALAQLDFEQVIIDPSQIAYTRAVADIDGDGQQDVITVLNGTLRWYAAPNFDPQVLIQLSTSQHGWPLFRADDLEAIDMDGDGDPDLVTRIGDSGVNNGNVVWFRNPRPSQPVTSTWQMHTIGANAYTKDIEVDDFDNDSKLDVVTREHAETQIWFQNSATSWTKKSNSHAALEGMDVGDLDNDGDPDIVLNGFWLRTPSTPRTGSYSTHTIDAMWFNQPAGFPNNCCQVVVADVNDDNKLDVILSNSEKPGYPVAWYSASNPTGSWQQHDITSQLGYCHTLHAADFNEDGTLDLLAGGMPQSAQAGLRLFLQAASGGWATVHIQSMGAYSAEVGDLHADGDFDIVNIRGWDQAPTEIWVNTLRDGTCMGDFVNDDTFTPPGDAEVNAADLAFLLGAWGVNLDSPADIVSNETYAPPADGVVDAADLATLLGAWGACAGGSSGGDDDDGGPGYQQP